MGYTTYTSQPKPTLPHLLYQRLILHDIRPMIDPINLEFPHTLSDMLNRILLIDIAENKSVDVT